MWWNKYFEPLIHCRIESLDWSRAVNIGGEYLRYVGRQTQKIQKWWPTCQVYSCIITKVANLQVKYIYEDGSENILNTIKCVNYT